MRSEGAKDLFHQSKLATEAIRKHAHRSSEILQNGRDGRIMVSIMGHLAEPQEREADLLEARAEIDAALNILKETRWPTGKDWDLLKI